MYYSYKEYEDQIFRIVMCSSMIERNVEIYRKGRGFVPFESATLILMHGYNISEHRAKQHITDAILRR